MVYLTNFLHLMQIRTRSRSVKTFCCSPGCLSSLLTSAGYDVSNPFLLHKQRHNPVPLMLVCLYHFPNSHDQFYLMVQISSCHRIRQLSTFRTNCICRFAEDKRGFSFRICSHIPNVISMILTHTINSMDRKNIFRACKIHSWGLPAP